MLPEPYRSIVKRYLDAGGKVLRVPFGISGPVFGFREISVAYGMRGWIQRFGIRHVPAESVPYILAGQLTVPQARAELVWELVRANNGRATVGAICKAFSLSQQSIEDALELLERHGAVRRDAGQRPVRFSAGPMPPPRWSDLIQGEQRAA